MNIYLISMMMQRCGNNYFGALHLSCDKLKNCAIKIMVLRTKIKLRHNFQQKGIGDYHKVTWLW